MVVVYGIYASFDREMRTKLFIGYSFDFWDSNRLIVLFLSHHLAIMGIYVCTTHYVLK